MHVCVCVCGVRVIFRIDQSSPSSRIVQPVRPTYERTTVTLA